MEATTKTLATLTGSEKQVSWANQIRRETLESAGRFIADMDTAFKSAEEKSGTPQPSKAYAIRDALRAYYQALESQTSAAWWIENSALTGGQMMKAEMVRLRQSL